MRRNEKNFCDFLFAYVEDVVFPKWGLLLKERICSSWSKFFSVRVDPTEMGGKNENDRVASPESILIYLNFIKEIKLLSYHNHKA